MDATTIDAAAAHRDNDIVQWLTSGTRDERFIDNIFANCASGFSRPAFPSSGPRFTS